MFWDFMESTLKLFLYTFLWASVLLGCSPKPSELTPDIKEDVSSLTRWRMVWVNDFGQQNLQHDGLAPFLENYIRSVSIYTKIEDGQLVTTSASAGCNRMGQETLRVVVTPARTVQSYQNGKVQYETTPATYKTETAWSRTSKACRVMREIDGKTYRTIWMMDMEDFIMENVESAVHSRKDDKLEWIDADGSVIAKEKDDKLT